MWKSQTTVAPIPAFNDNYIWAINDGSSRSCVVVDPGDSQAVENYLAEEQLSLSAILITHHHGDHTGGVKALCRHHTNIPVYGGTLTASKTGCITHIVSTGTSLPLFDLKLDVLEVPGHTLDHIAFLAKPIEEPSSFKLFCGDTLFSGGCGRVFEGTFEQMWVAIQKLMALPGETEVYPAHEYTLSNLKFARSLLPEDQALAEYEKVCLALREQNRPTLPTTLSRESEINLFTQGDREAIRNILAAQQIDNTNSLSCFSGLRRLKDNF